MSSLVRFSVIVWGESIQLSVAFSTAKETEEIKNTFATSVACAGLR